MEIPDFIIGLMLIYFLIVTMLVIGAISKYFFKRENESIQEIIRMIDTLIAGIGVGIFTGAIVVVYYNWVNCAYISDCQLVKNPNIFNIYYPLMLEVIMITLLVCCGLGMARIILIHKKKS
jgi:hypothetical protein